MFPGAAPGPPTMVVPSVLPLKLICDGTWPPTRKFSAYASDCHDLQRKTHWIAMVFNETTNYDFTYIASKTTPSWYIQLN